jgi:thymidylate synthase
MYRITPRTYPNFVKRVLSNAEPADSPRGQTLEVVGANLWLRNVRDRLVTDNRRKLNVGLAVLEFVTTVTGITSIKPFVSIARAFKEFEGDNGRLDGAYGGRLVTSEGSQLKAVYEMLSVKPLSRQAVVHFHGPEDVFGWKDYHPNVPCTQSIQFLIRHGCLDAIVTMRSNDLYLGLPYDLFNFTMIHEFLALQLGIPVGRYFHNVGTLHAYNKDVQKLTATGGNRWFRVMYPMPRGFDWRQLDILARFVHQLPEVITIEDGEFMLAQANGISSVQYTKNLALTMAAFRFKQLKLSSLARRAVMNVNDPTIRTVAYQSIPYSVHSAQGKTGA